MSAIGQDLRYALRSFARVPGFTFVALVTLALGIGGTTAIFSVVDGVVLRALPYPNPDHLVRITRQTLRGNDASFSPADYLDVAGQVPAFQFVAGYREDIADLTGRGEPVRVSGVQTTAAFFDVLGGAPLVGRMYHQASDRQSDTVRAVLAEHFWRTQFGADPAVVGSVVQFNGVSTEIIGVAPVSFSHPIKTDVWLLSRQDIPTSPLPLEKGLAEREVQYFSAIGRIRPEASIGEAQSQLAALGDRLAKQFPATNGGESFRAGLLSATLVADVRTALLVLLGSVGCVLLIACANVAGLLMARGAGRRRELALRAALGAGRGRLIRQLITESLVLAVGGGALGVLVAAWGLDLLISFAPQTIPRLNEVRIDWRIGAFAVLTTTIVGAIFGLMPALQSSKPRLNADLSDGGRATTKRSGTRHVLVVAQVALALVLLIGAGLMITSLVRLRAVDPGFRTSELVAVELPLPQTRYDESAQRRFYTGVVERLRQQPLTARSAAVFPFPLEGATAEASFEIEGQAPNGPDREVVAELNAISPGYFQAVGIRLLSGRDFAESDGENQPPVAIVNDAARKLWQGVDPIGRRVNLGSLVTVVGVVSDARRRSLDTPPKPTVYLPYTQFTLPFMGVVVLTDQGVASVATAVRSAVGALDPSLPLGDVLSIEQIIEHSTEQPRFRSFLLTSFAGVALLLAVVGIYGLVSFGVTQRVPEIGVRLSLGASPWQIFRAIIGQGLKLAAAGISIGLLAAVALTRAVTSLLFETSATDPMIYASLSALLLAIAGTACYVPARRAMRVDPMTALRAE